MKLEQKSVTLRNFLTYGNQPTTLEFDKGINLVLGYDQETGKSNTSGKSNLLMSIPFALYGKIPKDIKKARIPNWKNRKNCEVSLEFTKGDTTYTFHRGISPDFFEVFENGKKIPVETDMKTFQARIEEEILGMDFNSFKNYVYCNPNNVISIINTPKEQKRKLLESLFNVEVFSKMNTLANEKLRNVNQKLEINQKEQENSNKTIEKLEKEIKDIHIPDIEEIEREYNKWLEHYNSIYVENIDEQIEKIGNDRKEIEKELETVNKEIQDVDNKILECETEKKTHNKRLKEIGNIEEKKQEYQELLDKKEEIGTIDEWRETELNEVIEYLTDRVNNYEAEIKSKQSLINSLPDPNKLKGKSKCPTCGTEVNPDSVREHTETEKKRLEEEKKEIQGQLKEHQNKLQERKNELQELKNKQKEIDQIDKKLNELSHIKEKEDEVQKINKSVNDLSSEIDRLKKQKDEDLTPRKNEIDKRLEEYYNKEKEWNEYKEKINQTYQNLILKQKEYENAKESKEREEKRLEEKQQELQENRDYLGGLEKEQKKYNNLRDHLNFSKEVLKDENLKQYAISSHIPYFNTQVNHYLNQVGFNFYLNIDKWMEIEIGGPGIGDASLNSMSGGEVKSIDLAIKFALMDIAKMQAASYPDILILDEILDSSIDKEGLTEIINIVRYKMSKDDLKVFLISHREEMQDMSQIDKTFTINKQSGISKLEE